MNKSCLAIALAVMCLLGLSTRSHAQKADALIVTVPFDFVVSAKTMPAGTYTVKSLFEDAHSGVVFRGGAATAVVLPTAVEGTLSGESLTFERVDGKYFLRKIDTPVGVYTIAMPHMRMVAARTHDQTTVPASGTN
jgi:hypothetical protein